MPSVTIDAGVLAVPEANGSADDADRYVETLLDWRTLLDEPWVAIYMSDRASEALVEDGLFPLRDQLKRLFAANGVVEFDVNTVAQVVERLLRLTPSFEAYFSIRDILAEEITTEPDVLRLCCGHQLQSDLARCVILIAILRKHCREPVRDHSLILRKAPDRRIRVRALIHDLDHDRADLEALPTPPEFFEGEVLVCDDFKGLVESLDEAAILLKAADDVGVEAAVRIAVYKSRLARGAAPEWSDVPDHRVGHAFRSSFQATHPTQQLATRVLRAIVQTLEQTNMAATHWLRTGAGANNPQRLRRGDKAGAWRRDIDQEHHLHYWDCDGTVEIASVSFPHADFTIPD
jgi:Txe/YoeB family toxin of Txe-Axe toxin-antitoxin module